MKKVILTVSAFIFSLKLMAQAPEKMSYQAVVRNSSNGLVISAPVGMRISILQGSAAGASVYTETQTVNSNANGLVSLEIGSGTVVSGNFSTIDWSADTYFIQTETDPTGGTSYTVTGTSQLMSVPYALHAKTAESVLNDQVDDADADPTNELQNWSNLPGIPSDIADGDDVDDADADPANEIELPVGGTNAQVLSTDGTGNYSWVDQTTNNLPNGTAVGQTAYWNGTAWLRITQSSATTYSADYLVIAGGAGGGGASAVGQNMDSQGVGGNGGAGTANSYSGSSVNYAGGGGGGGNTAGTASFGGGAGSTVNANGSNGTVNTGGGGGGSRDSGGTGGNGGNGGAGIVILRYADSIAAFTSISGGLTYTTTTSGGYRIYSFTAGTGTVTI
jgi:hypothetical protein